MRARAAGVAVGVVVALSLLAMKDVRATGPGDNVCAGERGAAFGVCLAYCSALDCAADDPRAGARACGRLQTLYFRFTGMQPPCVRPTCPCASFDVTSITTAQWVEGSGLCLTSSTLPTPGTQHELSLVDAINGDLTTFTAGNPFSVPQCAAAGTVNGGPIDEAMTGISDEEAVECRRIVREAAQQLEPSVVDENFCGAP